MYWIRDGFWIVWYVDEFIWVPVTNMNHTIQQFEAFLFFTLVVTKEIEKSYKLQLLNEKEQK